MGAGWNHLEWGGVGVRGHIFGFTATYIKYQTIILAIIAPQLRKSYFRILMSYHIVVHSLFIVHFHQKDVIPASLSVRMFVPPLPRHIASQEGWAFVCDLLLRLPLCMFVRLVSILNYTDEIEGLLNHPIKRYANKKHDNKFSNIISPFISLG